jgi:exodeoxyribonuclease III
MLVATWNVNGLRARFDYITHWLKARQPDVIGLQELKMTDEAFPSDAFAELGYHTLTHGQKAWNGVAVLSREPGAALQRGLPGQEDFGSRLITADVAGIQFTTVYCPNGKNLEHADYERKLGWFDALVEHLAPAAAAQTPAIVCGDFNICPGALDSWDAHGMLGHIFHTDAERARMQALYNQGWTDLYRAQHPDSNAFSWWDYRAGSFQRNQGLRIDFVLANEAARERATNTLIDRDFRKKIEGLTASDHAPVITQLQ